MIPAGTTHSLVVDRKNKLGFILADPRGDEAQLPFRVAPRGLAVGDALDAFVYIDSDGITVATTTIPHAAVGDFAQMTVVDLNRHGAFLDWGLEKDLFVPNRLQQAPMERGRSYVVYVFRDERTGRATAASQLREYLDYDVRGVVIGAEVEALVYARNDVGWLAIVDQRYAGLIYANETFHKIHIGRTQRAWVKEVRESNKIDLSLQPTGVKGIGDAINRLRQALTNAGGSLPLHDRSTPEEISRALGLSKKAFKRALGGLYKAGEITLLPGATELKRRER